jgi:uncharacterized protein
MNNQAASSTRFRWVIGRLLTWSTFFFVSWLLCSLIISYAATHRWSGPSEEPIPETWSKIESLRLTTADGEELGAWFVPGEPGRPVVMLLHGMNGTLGRRQCLPQAEMFAAAGYSVLMITLRAHGDSTGTYNDIGYSAGEDVVTAVRWLEKHHAGMPIVIHGQSMGSAAALFAAGRLGERVKGYMLECPYQDLRTAVWKRMETYLPAPLDSIAYAGLLTVSPLALPQLDEISPQNAAAAVPAGMPVLILVGGADQLAGPEQAAAIAERCGGKTTVAVFEGAGADHQPFFPSDPARYRTLLLDFVEHS